MGVKLNKGRQAVVLPVSVDKDQARFIDRRVALLKPMVASRSHYLRLLVEEDKKRNTLGGELPKSSPNGQPIRELIAA
jgi:hypothetical protein